MQSLNIRLRTLTPIWTGGAAGVMDRVHETGLIGSLRWWYEAIVRGVGGWACDPTDETTRCEFDNSKYAAMKRSGVAGTTAVAAELRNVCPVCFIFGCGGWRRSFQLDAPELPRVPLHFRTTGGKPQREWLGRIFGGKKLQDTDQKTTYSIDDLTVTYFTGEQSINLVLRGPDNGYVQGQLSGLLDFIARFGALGARIQHGFGQVAFAGLSDNPNRLAPWIAGMRGLQAKIASGRLRAQGPPQDGAAIFDLQRFFILFYSLEQRKLDPYLDQQTHYGDRRKLDERRYVPCAFDLRYKGDSKAASEAGGMVGLRRWLKERQGWTETDSTDHLEELDLWLGPRAQWGRGNAEQRLPDGLRTAARVFFGMPYRQDGVYQLRIFGFVPEGHPKLETVGDGASLVEEYMQQLFGVAAERKRLGSEILAEAWLQVAG